MLLGDRNAEADRDDVEEWRVRQHGAACAKVFGDMEAQLVASGVQRACFEQRPGTASIGVRAESGQRDGARHVEIVQFHAHALRRDSRGGIEYVRRQSAHDAIKDVRPALRSFVISYARRHVYSTLPPSASLHYIESGKSTTGRNRCR